VRETRRCPLRISQSCVSMRVAKGPITQQTNQQENVQPMAAGPSLLQIIFFIIGLLAPADTTKVTFYVNPSDPTVFTKTASGSWTLSRDNSEWRVDGEAVVIHETKEGGKDSRIKVASFVGDALDAAKTLAAHDWGKEKSLKLSRGLTVEKSDDGFIFHMQNGPDAPVVDLHAVFTK
jgi:hypothetical protein